MKKLALLIAFTLLSTGASATGLVQNKEGKHYLATSKETHCSTPSGKTHRECARHKETPAPRRGYRAK